ncbi:hypothetical protein C3L33_13110, partial [Rhododendron williamsianum]
MASSSKEIREYPTPSLALRRFTIGKTQGLTEAPFLDDRVFIPNPKEKVLDVTQLLGLIPYGPQFDPTMEYAVPEGFVHLTAANGAFSNFYSREKKISGDVSQKEFFAYILYTLCKYILCHSGKRVMSEFIPLALALSRGEVFYFASYFLGHVYKVGSDFHQKGLNTSQGGPQWFMQLWLHAYFPEFGPFEVPMSPASTPETPNIHGDNYVRTGADETHTLVHYLCFFSGLASDREWPCPFSAPIGPSWLFDILVDKQGKSSTALQAWSNILTSREIFISSSNPSKSLAHAEVYCPAQFARQLGFVQGIPIPYCGFANISMSERSNISVKHFKTWFPQSKHLLRRTVVQDFKEPEVNTTSEFDYWWHTNCSFLFGCAPFKKFLKYIGFENSEFGAKIHNDSSSFSSDGGFGVVGGIEDTAGDEVNQEMAPIKASPISMIIPPPPPSRRKSLRVSQKRGATPSPEFASKRSKVTVQPKKAEDIPTKHYLEPSVEQQAPKIAKVTRKLKSVVTSSDEETETDTEAQVSEGQTKVVQKEAFSYARARKTKSMDELSSPEEIQEASPEKTLDLFTSSLLSGEASKSLLVQETAILSLRTDMPEEIPVLSLLPKRSIIKKDIGKQDLLSLLTNPIPPIPFQSKTVEQFQIPKENLIPIPLQVLEQDSLFAFASTSLLSRGFEEQSSDVMNSSLPNEMLEAVGGSQTILPLEPCSSMSPCEPPASLNDLPTMAFDFSLFKGQLENFCNQLSDPIPLISSNPLENLEQLLSPSKLSNSPSFRINHVPTEDEVSWLKTYLKILNHLGLPVLLEQGLVYHFEVCYQALFLSNKLPSSTCSTLQQHLAKFCELLSHNQFLSESIEHTTSKVEQLEARALKIAIHISSYQDRRARLEELNKRMK